jgi:hypothetical protein
MHDILCVANSLSETDQRCIVFGVSDSKNIVGLSPDSHKKTLNDIVDTLRNACVSQMPTMLLNTYYFNETQFCAVLQIKNIPGMKPYVLHKDSQGLKANIIYMRNLDSNVPKNKSATIKDQELLWRARFGLDLRLTDKIKLSLQDISNWSYSCAGNVRCFFYDPDSDISFSENEGQSDREEKSVIAYYFLKTSDLYLLNKIIQNSAVVVQPYIENLPVFDSKYALLH